MSAGFRNVDGNPLLSGKTGCKRRGRERDVVVDKRRRIQRELIFAARAIERDIEDPVSAAQHGLGVSW